MRETWREWAASWAKVWAAFFGFWFLAGLGWVLWWSGYRLPEEESFEEWSAPHG